MLGKALKSVAEQSSLGDGSIKKACFVDVLHLCQVEPEMALLDNESGHRLPEDHRHDFRRPGGEVSRCTQLLHHPRVGTTLVHLFQCLGSVYLQDSHGMQGRGGLACSAVSFGCESGRHFTGFGRETRTIPPNGCILRIHVHRNCSLHLGNVLEPPSHPAIKGSEDGRGRRVASGCVRGCPRLLLMHLWEERHWSRTWL